MAEVFSSAFTSDQHAQWAANQYAWDPSQLHVVPLGSPGSASEGAPSEQASEGLGSSSGAHRDQSLGPLPIGWQETSRNAACGGAGTPSAKETKGAHARAPKGPLICQVEGCGYDLSMEKGYYQRYRVCEPHMKLLSLVVNGKACRFCQQCGRFQELTEFDGNKRSCRARLLQHNARRRKRDPLDTSRKEGPNSRKSKSQHPWSDSSNDADMASGDVGYGVGTDKSLPHYSLDSGMDQSCKAGMAFGGGHVSQLSTGGAPTWATGVSGMMSDIVEPPANANQLPSQAVMQPQLLRPDQPLPVFNTGLPRGISGAADLDVSLDDVLDGILGGSNDFLEDPRMPTLPQGVADMRGSFTAPTSGGNNAAVSGLSSIPTGVSYVEAMSMNSQGHSGLLLGQNGYASSLPTSGGAWQPTCGMPVEASGPASASDLAAALNKRAMQQRQMQEMQQHQQQQLLIQQQQQQRRQLLLQQQQLQQQSCGLMPRASTNTGGSSSLTQLDNYMHSNSSMMSGGCGYSTGLGATDVSAAAAANAGQLGSSVQAVNRGNMGPWAAGNSTSTPVSGPQLLSGGMPYQSALSQAPAGMGMNASAVTTVRPSVSSSFDLARRLVAAGGAAARYESEDLLVRVSIKIANCTPDQLPPDLYRRLRNLLNTADASLVQGFLRPGCTHLVLDVQIPAVASGDSFDDADDGRGSSSSSSSAAALSVSLRGVLGSSVGNRSAVLVQTEEQVALWPAGSALSAKPSTCTRISGLQASGALPVIKHVSAAAHIDSRGRAALMVYGTGLACAGVSFFARIQGGYLPVAVTPVVVGGEVVADSAAATPAASAGAALRCVEALNAAGRNVTDAVLVTADCAPGSGLLIVEAQAGPLLSNWGSCLLLTDSDMVAELSAMEGRALHAVSATALLSLTAFTRDLGLVLDRRSYYYTPSLGLSALASTTVSEVPEEDENEEAVVDTTEFKSMGEANAGGNDGGDVTLALVCVCERLLAWASDVGIARVASFLAATLRQYGQDMQAILEAPYADGLAIVHRCMRSRNPEVVRALMAWASSSRVQLSWGSVGALGLSPLHLAALVPAAWRVLAANPAVCPCWETAAAAADGATPGQLQRQLLARLPRGALAPDVVAAFVPKVASKALSSGTEAQGLEKAASASASPGAVDASAPKPDGGRWQPSLPPVVGIAATVLVFAMATILFALQPAASRLRGGSDTASRHLRPTLLQRLAPEYETFNQSVIVNCCSSMLYVGLLGMAAFLLPVKTMMSGVHPASSCLGAP